MKNAVSQAQLSAIRPTWAVEGARVNLEGAGFAVSSDALPVVAIGGRAARVVFASPSRLGVLVPSGIGSGRATVEVAGAGGTPVSIMVASELASDIHQVDSPVFDRDGNLYAANSGRRGEHLPVSIYRIRPSGDKEEFTTDVVNATSMAFGPDGALYVSSRFEGTVYRVAADGRAEVFATELGVACGLAFGRDGTLFVGDRSGTIFRLHPGGRATALANLPASVAAYHLAIGPDDHLYVTGPTMAPRDSVYRIDADGRVETFYLGFGRPQGLAFDSRGALHVVEALAGASGVYRIGPGRAAEHVLAAADLVGIAIDPIHGIALSSNDTLYRLPVRA